jgi:hypothetical protein
VPPETITDWPSKSCQALFSARTIFFGGGALGTDVIEHY